MRSRSAKTLLTPQETISIKHSLSVNEVQKSSLVIPPPSLKKTCIYLYLLDVPLMRPGGLQSIVASFYMGKQFSSCWLAFAIVLFVYFFYFVQQQGFVPLGCCSHPSTKLCREHSQLVFDSYRHEIGTPGIAQAGYTCTPIQQGS